VLHFYDVLSPLKTSSPAAGSKTATLADPSYVEPGKATAELFNSLQKPFPPLFNHVYHGACHSGLEQALQVIPVLI